MKHFTRGHHLLLYSFAAETFFATYGLVTWSTALFTSIGYLLSGLLFLLALMNIPEIRLRVPVLQSGAGSAQAKSAGDARSGAGGSQSASGGARFDTASKVFKGLLLTLALALAVLTASYWFAQIDVDPDYADMLPVIRVMNERLLAGHRSGVYDIIPELWGGTRPIYLPAMWLPYSPSLLLGLDMRWTTVFSLLICFGLFIYFLPVRWKTASFYVLVFSAALLFWWIFGRDDQHGVISLSEEGPVILFYSLLCVALVSGNAWAIGVAVLLCMLSRYSFAGWLPAYGLILFYRKDYQKLLRIAVTVIAGVVIFFIIPFGLEPLRQMLTLPGNYTDFAARVWHDNPETFWINLGMAKFFGSQRIGLLHHCLVYGSFALPVLMTAICLLRKKAVCNNLPLAMLKGSLVIFYNLVDVPYGYLFFTSSFVSLIAVVLAWRSAQAFSSASSA